MGESAPACCGVQRQRQGVIGVKLGDLHIGQYVRVDGKDIGCVCSIDVEYDKTQPWKARATFVSVTASIQFPDGHYELVTNGGFANADDVNETDFANLKATTAEEKSGVVS